MKECIRQLTPCPFRTSIGMCNIIGANDYFCLDEETYMSEVLNNQETIKNRGIRDVRMIEGQIKQLDDYCQICPAADVLDGVMNAIKELRKARIKLVERYEIDIELLVKGA